MVVRTRDSMTRTIVRALAITLTMCAIGAAVPDALASPDGWAVGFGGTILHTSNGGSNWTTQASGTGERLQDVDFTDPLNGWAVGNFGTIRHTMDGGATWAAQANPGTSRLGVDFIDPLNGWTVGDGPASSIQHTTDGGATWIAQRSPTVSSLVSVAFIDQFNGWAVGQSGLILHTSNGGSTS